MMEPAQQEASISDTSQVLVVVGPGPDPGLVAPFAGCVLRLADASELPDLSGKSVYLSGDLSGVDAKSFSGATRVLVMHEDARGEANPGLAHLTRVGAGRAPVRVHGLGVYYRRFFDEQARYFERVSAEHTFQSLTESNKPSRAHRKGVYLTPVHEDAEGRHFHLLRCSTNLEGPTENFGPSDTAIVTALREEADLVFRNHGPLNHVLAQLYPNSRARDGLRQQKARIAAHADKTKDMPRHGVMAFCTFYDRLDAFRAVKDDPFDLGHRGVSALNRLHFRLKDAALASESLPLDFSITLYPNSVFFMPLSTNRLYTHALTPSLLDAETLPTRLGYVVRCSNRPAVHRGGRTFVEVAGTWTPLGEPSTEGALALRQLYAEENKSTGRIVYGDQFVFSLNQGDYLAPSLAHG